MLNKLQSCVFVAGTATLLMTGMSNASAATFTSTLPNVTIAGILLLVTFGSKSGQSWYCGIPPILIEIKFRLLKDIGNIQT